MNYKSPKMNNPEKKLWQLRQCRRPAQNLVQKKRRRPEKNFTVTTTRSPSTSSSSGHSPRQRHRHVTPTILPLDGPRTIKPMDPSSPAASSEPEVFESASSKSRPEKTPSSRKKLHRNDHQIFGNAV
jgi:hypothetical protein